MANWTVKKHSGVSGKYCLYNNATGKSMGKFNTQESAMRFAKNMGSEAYAKGGRFKSLMSKGYEGLKSGYSKGKEYTKNKIHDTQKRVALNVIDDTKDKVGSNSQKMILKGAEELVSKRYAKGGSTKNRKTVKGKLKEYEIFKNGTHQGSVYATSKKEAEDKVFAQYGEHREVYLAEGDEYAKGGNVKNAYQAMFFEKEDGEHIDTEYYHKKPKEDEIERLANELGATFVQLYFDKHKDESFDLLDEEYDFDKYAKGGFVGKGEMVWQKITHSKKAEFLHKHFTPEISPRTQEVLTKKSWSFLPKKVKIKFESVYANIESYAKGGAIYKGNKVRIKDTGKTMKVTDISKGKKGYVEFSGDKGTYLKGDLEKMARGGNIVMDSKVKIVKNQGEYDGYNGEVLTVVGYDDSGNFNLEDENGNDYFVDGRDLSLVSKGSGAFEKQMQRQSRKVKQTIKRWHSANKKMAKGGMTEGGWNYSIGGL